jgi:hypothetical protein
VQPVTYDPIQRVIVHEQFMVYASVVQIEGCRCEGLVVYKSRLVRDTDSFYQPIAEFLESTPHEVIWTMSVPDPEMTFGQADLTVYFLH